jgi:uncharacterized delta-60 repeat protein
LETAKSFTIRIPDNFLASSNREFKVTLRNASPGVLLGSGPSAETITIHDDERPGSVDFGFDARLPKTPTINQGGVFAVAVQPDDKVLAAGVFTAADSDALTSLRRLNPDGSTDTSFAAIVSPEPTDVGPMNSVAGVLVQPDGNIVIGGRFSQVNGEPRKALARLLPNGSLDETFNSSLPDARVSKVAFQNDGKIAVVGRDWGIPDRVMRLNSNGTLDTRYNASLADLVYIQALAVQPDGKIILANRSEEWSGPSRVLRLNVDGSLDSTFRTGSVGDAGISSIALQSDRKILLAGAFDTFNDLTRHGLVRLNTDGEVDTGFSNTGEAYVAAYQVSALSLQADGRILAAAESFYEAGSANYQNSVVRLNPDGTLDKSFDAGDGTLDNFGQVQPPAALAVLREGKIVVAGGFSTFDGVPRPGLVRLHSDPPLRLLGIAKTPSQTQVTVRSLPSRTYVLERSEDFRAWVPVQTNTATSYTLQIQDAADANSSHRFYRVLRTEP